MIDSGCGRAARPHGFRWAGWLILSSVLALGACADNLAICVDSSGTTAAVVVQVRDAVTGAPLAAGSRGSIRDGDYIDSLRPPSADASGRLLTLIAGQGRPGTYTVTVIHPGYQTWQQTSVLVVVGNCGLASQVLHANLEPLP
jgi:hypothetical protein